MTRTDISGPVPRSARALTTQLLSWHFTGVKLEWRDSLGRSATARYWRSKRQKLEKLKGHVAHVSERSKLCNVKKYLILSVKSQHLFWFQTYWPKNFHEKNVKIKTFDFSVKSQDLFWFHLLTEESTNHVFERRIPETKIAGKYPQIPQKSGLHICQLYFFVELATLLYFISLTSILFYMTQNAQVLRLIFSLPLSNLENGKF